ncbi:MAG: hypothetical protein CMP20_01795 [Rickettsiales bacterium]|nr:hypothetical protein [Rickettsiales bacterium]
MSQDNLETPIDAYNAFVRDQVAKNVDQLEYLLYVIPHWTAGSLMDGCLSLKTAMTVMVKLHKKVNEKWRLQCVFALFTLCEDPATVVESMQLNGFENTKAYEIFTKLLEIERPTNVLLDALEAFADGKASWIRAFLSSVVKFAWAQYLFGMVRGCECKDFVMFVFSDYVALLMAMQPKPDPSVEVNDFFQTIEQADIKGAKLATVEDYGETFAANILMCLASSEYDQYSQMMRLVSANRHNSPYAALLWRPFYRFDATQSLYDMIEQVGQMTLIMDMVENECVICYDAYSSVNIDGCNHAMCPQCLLRLLREPKTPMCPFCRSEISSVTELVSK